MIIVQSFIFILFTHFYSCIPTASQLLKGFGMRVLRSIQFLTLASVCLVLTSCGKANLIKVTGVVTVDGEPAHNVSVAFYPESSSGAIGHGFTDDNGNFSMYTTEPGDGILAGKYKVTILANPTASPEIKTMSQIMAEKHAGGGDMKNAGKDAAKQNQQQTKAITANAKKPKEFPSIYSDPIKTPLNADVPATTVYKFELKKDAK
jgi:hypothetical protein